MKHQNVVCYHIGNQRTQLRRINETICGRGSREPDHAYIMVASTSLKTHDEARVLVIILHDELHPNFKPGSQVAAKFKTDYVAEIHFFCLRSRPENWPLWFLLRAGVFSFTRCFTLSVLVCMISVFILLPVGILGSNAFGMLHLRKNG